MRQTLLSLAPIILGACGGLDAEDFSEQLYGLQCTMGTCQQPHDGCGDGGFLQPITENCDFDADLGQACLDAVQAVIDATPEMYIINGAGQWCRCGELDHHDLALDSEECLAMPSPQVLPAACDTVCTDL